MTKKRANKKIEQEAMEEIFEYENSKDATSKIDINNNLEKRFKPNKKQIEYINVIKDNTITICHGSAGCGKTIVTVYQGLKECLNSNLKLTLIRPIFESASKSLGFLPGTLEEKMEPHFKPFGYILEELIGEDAKKTLMKKGKIHYEVFNFIRGATLKNRFIICDEAQNMTVEEMILVTTRLGKNSKIVFTGDFYQSDLRSAKGSIMEFADMIKEIKGVEKFTFTNADVVRNPILVEVTKAWEQYKNKKDGTA